MFSLNILQYKTTASYASMIMSLPSCYREAYDDFFKLDIEKRREFVEKLIVEDSIDEYIEFFISAPKLQNAVQNLVAFTNSTKGKLSNVLKRFCTLLTLSLIVDSDFLKKAHEIVKDKEEEQSEKKRLELEEWKKHKAELLQKASEQYKEDKKKEERKCREKLEAPLQE